MFSRILEITQKFLEMQLFLFFLTKSIYWESNSIITKVPPAFNNSNQAISIKTSNHNPQAYHFLSSIHNIIHINFHPAIWRGAPLFLLLNFFAFRINRPRLANFLKASTTNSILATNLVGFPFFPLEQLFVSCIPNYL